MWLLFCFFFFFVFRICLRFSLPQHSAPLLYAVRKVHIPITTMDMRHFSSSPAPPGVRLSTIVAPPPNVRAGGPLSEPGSSRSRSTTSSTKTTMSHAHASLSPLEEPMGTNFNFSLRSNRAGGSGATVTSWDGATETSNLTFSQVSPSTGRQCFVMETAKGFPFHGTESDAMKDGSAPRRRDEAVVQFAALRNDSSATDSRLNLLNSNDRRSVSWCPQGLFGATLERFQLCEAASQSNDTTVSMGGTVLGAEVPADLPPEPSMSARRHLSGALVHAIQLNGGNVTPFMSITSPGLSYRSISFPHISVPQLSGASVPVSSHSLEQPTNESGAVEEGAVAALLLEEQEARAKLEHVEGTEFKKLRGLEVSEDLARARRDRAVQRRSSKYAGDTLLRQLEAEEKEQLHSEMRTRMRAAEAEHQQSMRELREKERLQPILPPPPTSDAERALASTATVTRPASETPACRSNGNGEVVAEIHRQRALKQHVPFPVDALKADETFAKLA